MVDELLKYLEILKDVTSPFYLILLFTLLFGFAVYIIFKTIVIPAIIAHRKEKDYLLSLFALLDPDPLIRFDKEGMVIIANDSASRIFRSVFHKVNIEGLLKGINIKSSEVIEKNETFNFIEEVYGKTFFVTFKSIPAIKAGQLYFNDITENCKAEKTLIEYQKRLKEYSINLQSYIEDEKHRIASDLHDSIGQQLLLLKMQLQRFVDSDHNVGGTMINSLEDTISELREIIYELKPKILEELGLSAALSSLKNKVSSETGITGQLTLLGDYENLDCKTELFIFRIVQEAVNNIIKHSKATEFLIELNTDPCNINLTITDNGIGFDTSSLFSNCTNLKGFGLFNIKEKVENSTGKLTITSTPGEGTVLVIHLEKET